jgi:addiction module HigA family antidote
MKKNILNINYATHPGLTLKEKLEELKITPEEFVVMSGLSIEIIHNILNTKNPITPEIADRLEKVLNIPASFWLSKQANYDKYTKGRDYEKAT